MAEHLSTNVIELYRRGELRGKQRFDAGMHIAECLRCSGLAGETEKLQLAHDSIRASLEVSAKLPIEHLSNEQIANYVNGKLDNVESEIVISHMAWCSLCEDDVNDIKSFANQVTYERKNNFSILTGLKKQALGFWKKTPRPFYANPAYAFATLVLAVTAFSLWFFGIFERPGGKSVTTVSNVTLPSQTSSPTPPANFYSESDIAGSDKAIKPLPESAAKLDWVLPADRLPFNAALNSGKIGINPEIAKMRSMAVYMGRSNEDRFDLLTPTGLAIREDKPFFRWQPLKSAVKYKVQLVDKTIEKTFLDVFVESAELQSGFELERGHRYRWHVVAILKSGEEVEGSFMNRFYGDFFVMTAEQVGKIEEAEKYYRSSKEPLAHIALAMRYADAGLIEDAERELKSYLKLKPNSPEAKKMLEAF